MKFILIFLALLFIVSPCCAEEDLPRYLRVAIVDNADSINLTVRCPYQVLTLKTYELLEEQKRAWNAKVSPTTSGIQIRDSHYKVFGINIRPKTDSYIFINGRRFRGDISIIRKENNKLLVINVIGVEDYLKGVLYHEISHRWPIQAIKAQAIAARTFAVYQANANKDKEFDLTSTTFSQVYGGRTSEKDKSNLAVEETKGEMLTYKGKIFSAYYHSCCGGHTEDASNLWKIDIEPLRGKICDFCQDSKHFKWRRIILLEEIKNTFRKNGYEIGEIISIEPLERNKSGRITNLKIKDKFGAVEIPAKDFRQVLGTTVIRSTNFEVKIIDDYAEFTGFGWGHGVGMCQWGAYGMSKKGYSAEEILKFYYPGAQITK